MLITKIIICHTCFEKIQPITDQCPYCKNLEKLDSDLADKGSLIFIAGVLFGVMIVLNIQYIYG